VRRRPALSLTTTTPADEVKYIAREIIATGYRALALKRHPDKGGSHQEMLALNHAHEWLKELAA
jgi:pyrimidine deaminase RibD-like protein